MLWALIFGIIAYTSHTIAGTVFAGLMAVVILAGAFAEARR